jgi:outer membrane protein assembly factor BamD
MTNIETQNNQKMKSQGPTPLRRSSLSRLLLICLVVTATAVTGACAGSKAKKRKTLSAEKIYEMARKDLNNSDFASAVRIYEELESRFPFANVSRQAQLDLMYAYYKNRAPESAEDEADQFIRENPTHPRLDYAYYIKGLASFEGIPNFIERWFRADLNKRPPVDARKSFQAFQSLVTRFPNSDYAADARQRMVFLRNKLADYEVAVASYYLDRGAYVGAINRCKYALENYDGAPAIREALIVMVDAYKKLDMPDLSANAAKVLGENFPGPVDTRKESWWKWWD